MEIRRFCYHCGNCQISSGIDTGTGFEALLICSALDSSRLSAINTVTWTYTKSVIFL
jgi:hypothetical protein